MKELMPKIRETADFILQLEESEKLYLLAEELKCDEHDLWRLLYYGKINPTVLHECCDCCENYEEDCY